MPAYFLCDFGCVLRNLKHLSDPPKKLNLIGKLVEEDKKSVVVIGTRQMSSYGRSVINYLVPLLVEHGFTIISGLALGCDSYAQEIALESGGRTIGVLGFGLNHIKADYNSKFIQTVIKSERGVVLSPFDRGLKPSKTSFIYRNGVMAALGLGVLVVEAKAKSGVFHTVNAALELGKEVMAVPGDIFSYNSVGPNSLINEGAASICCIDDVLSAF